MSGTKNTPGPWAVRVEEQHYVTSAEGRIANVLFPRYSADGAEVMANALLIATSPALLGSAQQALEALANAYRLRPDYDDDRIYDELPSSELALAFFALREAVKQAIGGDA